MEFDHHGHRVRAVRHGSGIDSTYTRVELRTPHVPAIVLSPRPGALEPERFTPVEDARLTRNTVGAVRPDVTLRPLATEAEFDRRFDVTAEDRDFARTVLTEDVRALLTSEPWFRIREVSFHDGLLWVTEAGGLSDADVLTNAGHLARLAAAVWGDAGFTDLIEAVGDGGRWGVTNWVNRRRHAANRQSLSNVSLVVRAVLVLALLVSGLPLAGNALAALTGLAPEVRLTVTSSYGYEDCPTTDCDITEEISGVYERDGTTHTITQSHWMSWSRVPDKDEVIPVTIGPFWWHPMIERTDTAVFLALYGLLPLLAAFVLVKSTIRRAHGGSRRE